MPQRSSADALAWSSGPRFRNSSPPLHRPLAPSPPPPPLRLTPSLLQIVRPFGHEVCLRSPRRVRSLPHPTPHTPTSRIVRSLGHELVVPPPPPPPCSFPRPRTAIPHPPRSVLPPPPPPGQECSYPPTICSFPRPHRPDITAPVDWA